MAWDRPTLAELVTRVQADFESRLALTGSILRRAMAKVMAKVWAGTAHLMHGHIAWAVLQQFAKYADEEFLLDIGSMYEITRNAATFSTGTTLATGTNGTDIPAGTVFVRDDGATFTSDSLVTIAGGQASVPLTAELAGADGDTEVGATLSLESPIADIDTDSTVEDDGSGNGLSGGADQETVEEYRTRVLEHLRRPPEGGRDEDYIAWAKEITGVTRVWVYRHENGLGTVVVRFVRDNDVSIFPSAGEVTTVQDKLDAEKPTTADVTAAAPSDDPVTFTLSITPDTAAIRTAVEAQLDDLFQRDAEPGDGSGRGTIYLSRIQTAVGNAAGIEDFTVTVPAADHVPAVGDLPTRSTVSYT